MKSVTQTLLEMVSDWKEGFSGAYNIRENGKAVGHRFGVGPVRLYGGFHNQL